MKRKTEVSNLFSKLDLLIGTLGYSLDDDLLELSVELGGHLTLSNVGKKLLLRRLEMVLDCRPKNDKLALDFMG